MRADAERLRSLNRYGASRSVGSDGKSFDKEGARAGEALSTRAVLLGL